MSKSFSIRPAAPGDVGDILRLIRALAEYEKLAHEVVATEEKLRATLFAPAHGGAEVLVATLGTEPDGAIVGFALFFHNYSTFLAKPGIYLEDLFVEPPHRGLGIGKALLKRLAKLALERGCGRLEWSVLDWNRPAIDFYLALGAKPQDDWTMYRVTGDALARLGA